MEKVNDLMKSISRLVRSYLEWIL